MDRPTCTLPTVFFNAHHSPIGAFASFTLGMTGATGGLGLELGKPADHDIFVGVEDGNGDFELLPFYRGADLAAKQNRPDPAAQQDSGALDRARYEVGGATRVEPLRRRVGLRPFALDSISRKFNVAGDQWSTGDLTFQIVSPVMPVPDPETGDVEDLKLSILPAVLAEVTVDNRKGASSRRAVFGMRASGEGERPALRHLSDTMGPEFTGVGFGQSLAIVSRDSGVASATGFSLTDLLSESIPSNLTFGLGGVASMILTAPAGEQRTFRFAICFYRGGIVTAGLETSYLYTRFWNNIEAVAEYALSRFDDLQAAARRADDWIAGAPLSDDQRFMLAHSIRSYYGSTQLLQHGYAGKPIWLVNEGEYRMMNTLDLTADQIYYEMAFNPWTVRNELELFVERYCYKDELYFPDQPETLHPGGISFTHDMGVANVFSRAGYSSYEKYGLHGCFSQMTHEELVNWLCCALIYGVYDPSWLSERLSVIQCCFQSMLNRDHPDPAKRNGIMSLESSRCMGGSEITTYDSLDASLGQSRGNVYLASKCWAVYVGLEKVFRENGKDEQAQEAIEQARRCVATIASAVESDGTIPAVIGEDVPARIIPAIEGLVFPAFFGCAEKIAPSGEFAGYVDLLREHFRQIVKERVCLFPGGAWKLSSTSDNSWLSKIYLCQYVARQMLGIDGDHVTATADRAHVGWLLDPRNAYWAWSDQILAGFAEGSKYYPRGVTAWLWLKEKNYRERP